MRIEHSKLSKTMHLYLLVPSSSPARATIEVKGRSWSLESYNLDETSNEVDLTYSCISYTWGNGRVFSPLSPSHLVSDRAIPALQSITHHRPSVTRVWIDAFCVPLSGPERHTTLTSMGHIYSQASEVIVVLSSAAQPVLTRMRDPKARLIVDDLAVLEKEEWVERAWTYQEAVNSRELFITCSSPPSYTASVIIPADRFFSSLGDALAHFQGSIVDKLHNYPRLNAFEDIMADYYTAGFEERAALNIMSNMDRRVQGRAGDHFYAMMGAISSGAMTWGEEGVTPCEAFMRLCERKGDFSFIFSAAKRDEVVGRRWRPVAGDLPSILPWHGWGDGQPGKMSDEGLRLDKMAVVYSSPVQEEAKHFIERWLRNFWKDYDHSFPTANIEEAAVAALRLMGFRGSARYVATSEGLFFPYEPIACGEIEDILVSTALRWSLGAPGLVRYAGNGSSEYQYVCGVFFGHVDKKEAVSIQL